MQVPFYFFVKGRSGAEIIKQEEVRRFEWMQNAGQQAPGFWEKNP